MIQSGNRPASRCNAPWSPSDAVVLPRVSLTRAQRSRIEKLEYGFGKASVSYDAMVEDGFTLFSPCGSGLVNILADGRFWHVGGGLVCPDELRSKMVHWLKQVAAARSKTILVFSVGPDDVQEFRNADYEVNPLGMEPVLPLGDVTWAGREFSWVRRQTSFCQRQGLQFQELDSDRHKTAHAQDLYDIFRDDLQGRPLHKPLRILDAAFDPFNLCRRRIFVARDTRSDSIAGFVLCTPMRNGTEWAFETYRKRSTAPRGTIAFLFRQAIDQLQSEGIKKVSLCIVLGKDIEQAKPEGHWLIRYGLRLQYRNLNTLFNSQGQDYFKQRFRPAYEPRYACVTPNSSPQSLYSFMRTSNALVPSPVNLARRLSRSLRNRIRIGSTDPGRSAPAQRR